MIKHISLRCLAALLLLGFVSCEKDTTDNVSTVLKVPIIELNGDELVVIPVGGTYTDAGAQYTGEEGNTETIQATSGTVNTAQPGLYFINYSKTSTSGIFETQATRTVAVTYRENPYDYSGSYRRTTNGVIATFTRVAPGLYRVQNPGGAVGHDVVVAYFVESALNTFIGPEQPTAAGQMSISDITLTPEGGSWIIHNDLYLDNLRSFIKQ